VDVRSAVERLPPQLLRTHELRRSENDAGRRELVGAAGIRILGETEIQDHRALTSIVARAEHDVLGFEIAVYDAQRVRRFEAARDILYHLNRAVERHEPLAMDSLDEQLADEKRHHDVHRAVPGLDELDDVADVRMLESHPEPRFATQARHRLSIARERRRQHLDGALGAGAQIGSEIDDRHAARAELSLNLVSLVERLAGKIGGARVGDETAAVARTKARVLAILRAANGTAVGHERT